MEAPDYIKDDPVAFGEWQSVTAKLETLGLLAETDTSLIALYCQSYSDWRHCVEAVKEHGDTQQGERGGWRQISPEASNRNLAAKQMLSCLNELGLSPNARKRMRVNTVKKPTGDKWAKLKHK